MKLHCPDCGAEIPADDINLQTLTAKCARCNAVFSFAGGVTDVGLARRAPVLPTAGRPPRMTVEDFGGTWSVHWRWFSASTIFLTFFCIIWDSFLLFWYHIAFMSKHVIWMMVLFPLLHVAVGIGLTYGVLCAYANRTTVSIRNRTISIRNGPLPSTGNRELDAGQIDHLITGWGRSWSSNNNSSYNSNLTATLSAVMKNGEQVRLVGGFTNADEPAFLQQQLEQKLKLPPQPVRGLL